MFSQPPGPPAPPGPRRLAVIGAAALGRALARLAARSGLEVFLEDLTGIQSVEIARGIQATESPEVAGRIHLEARIEDAARRAGWVIEAAPEDLESKIEVFTILDKAARPGALLVTTSAECGVSEIATISLRAPRIMGMRFTFPVQEGAGVDLVAGRETDDAALIEAAALAAALQLRIGKTIRE